MISFLKFYIQGFWSWLGITIGMAIALRGLIIMIIFIIVAIRGGNIKID